MEGGHVASKRDEAVLGASWEASGGDSPEALQMACDKENEVLPGVDGEGDS